MGPGAGLHGRGQQVGTLMSELQAIHAEQQPPNDTKRTFLKALGTEQCFTASEDEQAPSENRPPAASAEADHAAPPPPQ